ncbi:MAG: SIMPL domain-containing protein [Microbacterium sp.]
MSDVTITVRGEHETRVTPEEAIAHLTVRTEGPERGEVVERIAALTAPLRDDLSARKLAGGVADWSSQRVSLWANRPWNSEGTQLALVHYASVEVTATFTDFAALSWWVSEVSEYDGVQIDGITWRLTPESAKLTEAAVAAQAVRVAVERATAYAAAISLATVTPIEIADLGLLTRGDSPSPAPAPEMLRMSKAAFSADAVGGGPALEFQPDDIVVSAAVEARFTAS